MLLGELSVETTLALSAWPALSLLIDVSVQMASALDYLLASRFDVRGTDVVGGVGVVDVGVITSLVLTFIVVMVVVALWTMALLLGLLRC